MRAFLRILLAMGKQDRRWADEQTDAEQKVKRRRRLRQGGVR
jgi:hypothetical protein